jgi:tetratricopeptide (TPR) repeat protein
MPHTPQFLRMALLPLLLALPTLCLQDSRPGVSADYEKALAWLKEGRPAEALPLLEAARERQPSDPDVLYNLAGCYFALNRSEDGARIAEELARQNSRDPAVLLAAGSLLAEHSSPVRAAGMLTAADALAPGNPLVLNALASAQFNAGDTGAATASLERLLSNLRSTLSPETRATLASACQTARALHAGDPSSLRTGMLAAEFDLMVDRPKEAWETLQPLEAAAGRDPDYYKLLGLAYARLDRFADAIHTGQHALRLAPARQDLLLNLAGVYQQSRDNQAAIRLLQDAIRQGAASPGIYFALALSQFNYGSYEEAVRSCGRALALDPKFDRAALLKGRALGKLSRRPEAIEWLARALEINPGCEFCRYELAATLMAENRMSEAEPLLRQVVSTTPSNALAQYELGKLLDSRGNTAEALAALQAAVAASPDQDDAWYLLGRIYLRKGDKAQAERALAAVKEIKERRLRAAREHMAGAAKSGSALTPAQP